MRHWANFVIVAIRYDEANEYITHIKRFENADGKLINLRTRSRASLIKAINNGRTYVTATKNTKGKYIKGSEVILSKDLYLQTSPRSKKRDDIGALPQF